jgi:hypothetical protein
MNPGPNYGDLLRQWLPALWRERDARGDLSGLLAVYGELLDAFHATVAQRRYDSFPDRDSAGRHCQDWLLPYIAQLLDVRLVSPDQAGRRAELADAVAWRQRKGTRVSIEAIAEAVGQFEVEIQEGWKRVAITPRVDRQLLPEAAYGEREIPENAAPAARARHPGLPAATLDLRYCSRAVRCDPANAGAHQTRFAGQPLAWRQANRQGLPCAPGSFQDVSRRTVDLRTPEGRRGQIHPRRVLLYLPPPEGHCSARAPAMNWSEVIALASFDGPHLRIRTGSTTWNGASLPLISYTGLGPVPLRLRGVAHFTEAAVYRFENLWLDNKVQIDAGAAHLRNGAARQLTLGTAERAAPVIDARDCLFKKLEAARGRVCLEYVTVLDVLLAERLDASDSILMPPLRKDTVDKDVPAAGCIRYSRIFHLPAQPVPSDPPDPAAPLLDNDPLWRSQGRRSLLRVSHCTGAQPLFWSDSFGDPGCGVLHPDCAAIFQSGAEDSGELGACHGYRYVLRQRAVLEKLQEFLPVGIEAVLVADPSLACAPPKATHS